MKRLTLLSGMFTVCLICFGCLLQNEGALAGGSGSGTETENTVSATIVDEKGNPVSGAKVSLRRQSYLPGVHEDDLLKSDTVTDETGGFRFHKSLDEPFVIMITKDSGKGALLAGRLPPKGEPVDFGRQTLAYTGSITMKVRNVHLDSGTELIARVYGTEKQTTVHAGQDLVVNNLPAGTFSIHISTSKNKLTGAVDRLVTVHPESETVMDDINLPIDYWRDSLAVAGFLQNQGLFNFDYSQRAPKDNNRIVSLDLGSLGMANLHPSVADLNFLRNLLLDSNQIQVLPQEIGELPELRHLDLAFNPLQKLPSSIGKMNLTSLNLDETGLDSLPPEIVNARIRLFRSKFNGWTEIPQVVLQMQTLFDLNLGGNDLARLPNNIGDLDQLQGLHLEGSNLRSIPQSIGKLTKLRTLYLYNNQIDSLPNTLGSLTNLRILHLNSNNLATLPTTIGQLSNLQSLSLYNNQLSGFPEGLRQLDIKTMEVDRNQLCNLSESFALWLDTVSYSGSAWRNRQTCP